MSPPATACAVPGPHYSTVRTPWAGAGLTAGRRDTAPRPPRSAPRQYPAPGVLHQKSSGGNVPALHAVAHAAIHVALRRTLGDETHIQRYRATNAKHLVKLALPLHGIQMLPQGVAWRIIENQTRLVEATNVSHTHRVAIDGGFCSGDGTVKFVVERMVHDPYKGLGCTAQGNRHARKVLPADVRLGAIQGIDNPGIGRGRDPCARLFADDGVVGKVVADNIANSRISERIDIGDDFLTLLVGNLQGSKTMLEQDPATN